LPEYDGLELHELLERVFNHPRYVWVTQRDKVRQAVSLWRALQTRTWRAQHSGDERDVEVHYRFEGIDHLVRSLLSDDDGWLEFFNRRGTAALRMVYEDDLEPDPSGAVAAVLKHIGVRTPRGWRPREVLVRQADALSVGGGVPSGCCRRSARSALWSR
jgi:LPS sulfotransferase NodH